MTKMAIFGSNHHHKAFCVLGLFVVSLVLLMQRGGAHEFKVGESDGWTLPSDSNGLNYTRWAEKNRFQIGDTLVFDYKDEKDSVLQVTKEDYANCNTASPIKKLENSHTVFKFKKSGPFYFISGVKDNCAKGEKLVVVVMADRSAASSSNVASLIGSIAAFLGSSLLFVF